MRRWPEVRRNLAIFLDSPVGRVLTWGFVFYLIASGLIFSIMIWFFNLLFLALLLGQLFAPVLVKRQLEEA